MTSEQRVGKIAGPLFLVRDGFVHKLEVGGSFYVGKGVVTGFTGGSARDGHPLVRVTLRRSMFPDFAFPASNVFDSREAALEHVEEQRIREYVRKTFYWDPSYDEIPF